MDITTIIGIVTATVFVLIAIFLGGGLGIFINAPSIMITVGGTVASTLTAFPLHDIIGVLKVVKKAFLHKAPSPINVIAIIIKFAVRARRDGILALEEVFFNEAETSEI